VLLDAHHGKDILNDILLQGSQRESVFTAIHEPSGIRGWTSQLGWDTVAIADLSQGGHMLFIRGITLKIGVVWGDPQ
jgi:hypothetical protein